MVLSRGFVAIKRQWHIYKAFGRIVSSPHASVVLSSQPLRRFTFSRSLYALKPVLLADIGEGIVECEVIQWFVESGVRVEEFSPLCEVQSDKASVEITSRFAGTVRKLHYEAGEMAKVGKPFVDIEIEDSCEAGAQEAEAMETVPPPVEAVENPTPRNTQSEPGPRKSKEKMASLATPAVRHLSKELNVDIIDVDGSGKDGRVLKEDIYKLRPKAQRPIRLYREWSVQLTQTQQQMFKTMSRSLAIPHFLYADEVDFSDLVELRTRLNRVLAQAPESQNQPVKLSYLPFIIKAASQSINRFPVLNARVDVDSAQQKPSLIMRSQHNIGVAMDTKQGLVVPVIRDVGALSIMAIAAELSRLQGLAQAGKLAHTDMAGGTITVSNIGNIGGTYLSPVIVEREVAILGIGCMRAVPAFDEHDQVVKKHVCNFSWSADHRVVDGATMARAAEVVRRLLEEPDTMVLQLR